MALVNIMETIVKQRLDEILEHTDCCKCNQCYMDTMAIALNYCKPKYVNTLKGELLVKISSSQLQDMIDLEISILKAIEIVKQHPNHE